MLALATGWTQAVIGEGISDDFRRACHWALYIKTLVGDGLPDVPRPERGATAEQLGAIARMARNVAAIREVMYPEDDDG